MATPSLYIAPDMLKAGKLYSQLPPSGAGDFTVVRNTTATRVNASGLIESVAANVPRIDYRGGGCGSLLVEPAATNLFLRSEGWATSPWTAGGTGTFTTPTRTNNAGIAPNGTSTATRLEMSVGATSSDRCFVRQSITASAVAYNLSYYVKSFDGSTYNALFHFAGGTPQAIAITNQWTRVDYSALSASGTQNFGIEIRGATLGSSLTADILVWGAQLETGSVATSYIPTVASTQTRNADVISLTGASALIGQASGTIYAEINLSKLTGSRYIIAIVVNTTNYFAIRTNASNAFIFRYRNGGSETTIPSIPNVSNSSTGIFKLALAYQDGNYAAAVNGTVYPSTASGIFPSGTFETVDLSFTTPLNDRITTAALYPTRLDNATLAQLTTL